MELYSMAQISRILKVDPETIRNKIKKGYLTPDFTKGKRNFYSEDQMISLRFREPNSTPNYRAVNKNASNEPISVSGARK